MQLVGLLLLLRRLSVDFMRTGIVTVAWAVMTFYVKRDSRRGMFVVYNDPAPNACLSSFSCFSYSLRVRVSCGNHFWIFGFEKTVLYGVYWNYGRGYGMGVTFKISLRQGGVLLFFFFFFAADCKGRSCRLYLFLFQSMYHNYII